MSRELVAVAGCTLEPDDTTVECIITPQAFSSDWVKVEGSGAYVGYLTVTVTGIQVPSAGATIPDIGPHTTTISSTATKTKARGYILNRGRPVEVFDYVVRAADVSNTINATPQIPNPSGDPIDYPVSFKVKITDAGQNKVRGE